MAFSIVRQENTELQAYNASPEFGLTALPFLDGSGEGTDVTLIDCTALGGASQRTKRIRFAVTDQNNITSAYKFWFADNREQLEDRIANTEGTSIAAYGGNMDITFDITTSWIGIDYDRDISGGLDTSALYLMLILS
jgi:hypothetical protein